MPFWHCSRGPLVGDFVLPWNELNEEQRLTATQSYRSHQAVAQATAQHHYHPDLVYMLEADSLERVLEMTTTFTTPENWVYQVLPIGPVWLDPEPTQRPASRTCGRALILELAQPGKPS